MEIVTWFLCSKMIMQHCFCDGVVRKRSNKITRISDTGIILSEFFFFKRSIVNVYTLYTTLRRNTHWPKSISNFVAI